MQVYVFIHRSWRKTKDALASINESSEGVAVLYTAIHMIVKAFHHTKYTLMRTIFDAVDPKYWQMIIKVLLKLSFKIVPGTSSYALIETLVLNDAKGKYLTAALFRMLNTRRQVQVDDFTKLIEHPAVSSEQFAKIVGDILLNKDIGPKVEGAFASVTGSCDVPALNKHLKSKALQKQFFGYSGIETLEIESVWLILAPALKGRKGIWRREHKRHAFEQLEAIGYFPKVINELISQYAA